MKNVCKAKVKSKTATATLTWHHYLCTHFASEQADRKQTSESVRNMKAGENIILEEKVQQP